MSEEILEKLRSAELEMSVIGSIFSDSEAAYYALNQLSENDFMIDSYREPFISVMNVYSEDYSVDQSLVELDLSKRMNGSYDKYISAIHKAKAFCNPSKIEKYCADLQSFTLRRNIVKGFDQVKSKALDLSSDTSELIEELDRVRDIEFESTLDIARTSSEIKDQSSEDIPQLITGLKEWDTWFYLKGGRGLGTTELVFARPGHGKTYYINRKIGEIALNNQKVLHFPLEDVDIESSRRIDAVVDPTLEENDNILIIDNKRYLHDVIKYIRYYHYKHGIKCVSIDHLGRIKVRGFRADQKVAAMIEASNSLTDLCNDLKIHGIWAVQPNKSYKQRKGYDNILREEDLKGASEVFEDAFVVTTLIRPNIYPELRGGVGDQAYVKSPSGQEAYYDSLFCTQIKNRRQRITDDYLHMVQLSDKLYTEREFRNIAKTSKSETKTHTDEDIPF